MLKNWLKVEKQQIEELNKQNIKKLKLKLKTKRFGVLSLYGIR